MARHFNSIDYLRSWSILCEEIQQGYCRKLYGIASANQSANGKVEVSNKHQSAENNECSDDGVSNHNNKL